MAINKSCFYNSVKSEFTEIGKLSVVIAVGLIVTLALYWYKDAIDAALTGFGQWLIQISPTWLYLITCVSITTFILYATVNSTKPNAKDIGALLVIGFQFILTAVAFFTIFMFYSLYAACNPNMAIAPDVDRFIVDSTIIIIICLAITVITSPFAIAYARCKEE